MFLSVETLLVWLIYYFLYLCKKSPYGVFRNLKVNAFRVRRTLVIKGSCCYNIYIYIYITIIKMDEDSRYFLSFYLCYRHISFYLNAGNVHGKKYLMYRKMRYIHPRAYIPNSRALRSGIFGWRIFGWRIFGKTYIRRGVIIAFQENGIINTSIVFFL